MTLGDIEGAVTGGALVAGEGQEGGRKGHQTEQGQVNGHHDSSSGTMIHCPAPRL